MIELKVRITTTDEILGTASANPDIHEDSDGLGKYIMYGPMHPSSYTQYVVSYEYSNMEHTVDTPDGEVAYQVVISNRGK